MKIIGCDLHTRYQQIAMVDTAAGRPIAKRRAGKYCAEVLPIALQSPGREVEIKLVCGDCVRLPDGQPVDEVVFSSQTHCDGHHRHSPKPLRKSSQIGASPRSALFPLRTSKLPQSRV
jgi:hypothetical protein